MFPVWKTDCSVGPWARTEARRAGAGTCPSLTRAPHRNQSFPGELSRGLQPPLPSVHGALLTSGRCQVQVLPPPLLPAQAGLCPLMKWEHAAPRGLHKALGTRWARVWPLCSLSSSLFSSELQGSGGPGDSSHLSGGSVAGGWEGRLWAPLSIQFSSLCKRFSPASPSPLPGQANQICSRTALMVAPGTKSRLASRATVIAPVPIMVMTRPKARLAKGLFPLRSPQRVSSASQAQPQTQSSGNPQHLKAVRMEV